MTIEAEGTDPSTDVVRGLIVANLGFSAKNVRKTVCVHGHPYDDENTYVRKDGRRMCRACGRAKSRRAFQEQRTTNPEGLMEQGRNYRRANREKCNARAKLTRAIARGDVVRPDRCGDCGLVGRVFAHHTDYSKPLDVVWVCWPCHGLRHRDPEITKRQSLAAAYRSEAEVGRYDQGAA